MTKKVSAKKTSAIFLLIVLVAGTFAAMSPSFIIGVEAQAETYYKTDSYKQSYAKDSYKSKDSSSAIVKKVKCNNINVNINGLQLDGLPPVLSGLATEAQASVEVNDASSYRSDSGSNGGGGPSGSDNDFRYVCINNNNNTVVGGEEPPVPPEDACLLCFEEISDELRDAIIDALEAPGNLTIVPDVYEVPETVITIEGLCEWLTDNKPLLLTQAQIDALIDSFIDANPTLSRDDIEELVECLIDADLIMVVVIPPEGLRLNIVWQDIRGSNDQDIYYGSNLNNDATIFGSPVNVSNNDEPSLVPRVASLGERIFVTWTEQGSGALQDEVFFAKSEDGGLTFTTPINISRTSGDIANDSEFPDIAAFGDNVYIVWEEGNLDFGSKIFFSKSIDGGDTFSEPVSLIDLEDTTAGFTPTIAVDEDGNLHVAYDTITTEFFPPNVEFIVYIKSTDEGETFTDPLPLSNTGGTTDHDHPRIATSGDSIYVTWHESNGPASQEIFFAKSDNEGSTFDTAMNISNTADQSNASPDIAAFGDNVYVVWSEGTIGNREIVIVQSNDRGEMFTSPLQIIPNPDFLDPAIDANEEGIFVVWWGSEDPAPPEVFFTQSNDGINFSDPINISNNDGPSQNPDIDIS